MPENHESKGETLGTQVRCFSFYDETQFMMENDIYSNIFHFRIEVKPEGASTGLKASRGGGRRGR